MTTRLDETRGEAIKRLTAESRTNPYDIAAREELANEWLAARLNRYARGSIERGQFILKVLALGHPTNSATVAYFDNLRVLFKGRKRLPQSGKVVLGLGSGRCGSTTLTSLLATVTNSCCTHENPPQLFWSPTPAQVEFHFARLRYLSQYFELVFDAAHWWLNVVPEFLSQFEDGELLCLYRDATACAHSFVQLKGSGKGSINHWAPQGNGYWTANIWDPTYPSYELERGFEERADDARFSAVERYIREYNERLTKQRLDDPVRVHLFRTEELDHPLIQNKIFDSIGVSGVNTQTRLNVGHANDGDGSYWF